MAPRGQAGAKGCPRQAGNKAGGSTSAGACPPPRKPARRGADARHVGLPQRNKDRARSTTGRRRPGAGHRAARGGKRLPGRTHAAALPTTTLGHHKRLFLRLVDREGAGGRTPAAELRTNVGGGGRDIAAAHLAVDSDRQLACDSGVSAPMLVCVHTFDNSDQSPRA